VYRVPLKAAIVEAMRNTFDTSYPVTDFQNLWVDIEYPNQPQNYPGIWVNYEDTGVLKIAGINQIEVVQDANGTHQVTRWRFEGEISFTVGAMSSLERDRLFDEIVRVLGFARVDATNASEFRNTIENNDFLGININYDVLNVSGDAAQPGTPWGTEETIYELTLSADLIGEFVSDPGTNNLVLLSAIQVQGYHDGTPAPNFPDQTPTPEGALWSPNAWGA